MSTATQVVGAGPQGKDLEWLTIEDDAGKSWKYVIKRALPKSDVFHVRMDPITGRIALTRDSQSVATLKRSESGLPRLIIVDYCTLPHSAGMASMSTWQSVQEFEQEGYVPLNRAELVTMTQEFMQGHGGKEPTKIHLPRDLEARLDVERKAELKGDPVQEPDFRKAFPTLLGAEVVWDAEAFGLSRSP